jgi:hypothetical protein
MESNMKKILFISGFNTHPDEQSDNLDIYSCFYQHFKYSKYKISFFRYKTDEPLEKVYKRMCEQLDYKEYKIIIGHSLGGGLLMKYLSEHEETRKIILLMPFISLPKWKQIAFSYLDVIPVTFHLPKCVAIPNSSLFEGGNLINDKTNMVNLSQITYATNNILLDNEDILRVFKKSKNVVMLYADDETISPIDCGLLERIEQKIYVKGKHVSFADIVTNKKFFEEFSKLL